MAKRIAEKELTDRNWDQEEDTEEAGIFSVASEDVLKGRAIKKAKRRNIGLETESGGAFKGFKGLALPTSGGFSGFGASTGVKSLDILSNGNGSMSTNLSFTNMKATTETKTALGSLTANGTTSTLAEKNAGCTKANGETPHPATSVCNQRKNSNSSDYNKQLAALNCSVRDWIVKHVDSNPLCDLTPIFRDYEKYLASIDQKFGSSTESESESDGGKKSTRPPSIATFGTSQKEQGSTFSFNKENSSINQLDRLPEKKSESLGAASKISFNFGQKVDSPVLGSFGSGAAAAFSFSSGNHSEPVTPKFSIKVPESQTESENVDKEKDGNEDSEEPPKAIVNEVKEDDAFYSKKCKLFYKKDNEYKEKGVGTLHLKPVGNKKTQLLVRADTNLGNILLNVLVQPSMACSRTGKNNVIVLCIPNPPIDEKNPNVPVTMLIRVKTSDDADELLKMLNEKKEEWSSQ